jgi:5-methylcytosine-specific restriction endonuclease McrA
MNAYYYRRKAAGLCCRCNTPLAPSSSYLCIEHLCREQVIRQSCEYKAYQHAYQKADKEIARRRAWQKSVRGRELKKAWYETAHGREYKRAQGRMDAARRSARLRALGASGRMPQAGIGREVLAAKVAAFGWVCAYCEQLITELHWDHIVPVSHGGEHVIDNLVPTCAACNLHKGNRPLSEFLKEGKL